MKRESKTKRLLRKELSKESKEDLELLAGMHFQFRDDAPRELRRNIQQRKLMAEDILISRGLKEKKQDLVEGWWNSNAWVRLMKMRDKRRA